MISPEMAVSMTKYRQRNIVGRCIGWIKELRRICTRYDYLASSFLVMVCLACIDRCLRADFSDKT
ncbi:transposase [Halomonas ventosae]